MAIPGVPNWQNQILTGVGAPITPQNLRALNAWQQAEGGTASNNPFNTTQPMPGATPYNTLDSGGHVYSYQTPQQGINATIQTLKGPIGNYGPILAALRAGTNPMAVAQAIAGSQWGTGSGVVRQLGGQAPISPNASVPASMPPGQPAVPGASPRLPQVNMPPAPRPPQGALPSPMDSVLPLSTNSASSILPLPGSFSSTDILGSAAKALGMEPHPLSTPVQQVKQPAVSATTPTGVKVEVTGKPDVRDVRAVQLAEHFLGTPYQWGGASPQTGFDCSGLLQYVWGKQGVQIPRTTYDQFQAGKPVAKGDLKPGDALYFTGSDPKDGLPGHVGMYVGGGKFIEAPHSNADIRISDLASRSDFVGARSFV